MTKAKFVRESLGCPCGWRVTKRSNAIIRGRHLIHEVTSPQAFGMLREKNLPVRYPERTFATVDHIVPTNETQEPYSDPLADAMIKDLRKNCDDFGVTFLIQILVSKALFM